MLPSPGDLVSLHGSSLDVQPISIGILISSDENTFEFLGDLDSYYTHNILTSRGMESGSWYLRIIRAYHGQG